MIDAAQPNAAGKELTGREIGETCRVALAPSKPTAQAGEFPTSREDTLTGLAKQLWPSGAGPGVAPVSQVTPVACENENEFALFPSTPGPGGSSFNEA